MNATGPIPALGAVLLPVALAFAPVQGQGPPPNINQCKSKWVLTALQQMDFGGFAIEAGSGSKSGLSRWFGRPSAKRS